jgi:hypothetical protein
MPQTVHYPVAFSGLRSEARDAYGRHDESFGVEEKKNSRPLTNTRNRRE